MTVELTGFDRDLVVGRQHLIALAAGEIHLWLAYYSDIDDEDLLAEYRLMLREEERQREKKFYFARDRRCYLVTRALVRTVLSRYGSIQPEGWLFSTNAYGRPEIANPTMGGRHVCFNISHTHSLIVLGITRREALGVDVENTHYREAPTDLADRLFARSEASALAALCSAGKTDRFWEYWTFKESYVKARAMGLSIPLHKVSFTYPTERSVELVIHPDLRDEPSNWEFWQFRPSAEYLLAVCAERTTVSAEPIVVRKAVPLVSEELMLTSFSRVSARAAIGDSPVNLKRGCS